MGSKVYGFLKPWNPSVIPFRNRLDQHNSFLMRNEYVPSLNSDFIREGANFQERVVGGKMNSEAFGQKVKFVS